MYKEQEDNKHESDVRASNNSKTNEGVVGPQPVKMVVHSRWEKLRIIVNSIKMNCSVCRIDNQKNVPVSVSLYHHLVITPSSNTSSLPLAL